MEAQENDDLRTDAARLVNPEGMPGPLQEGKTMEKEEKMKPSDKKRRRLMRWSSSKLSIIGFTGIGILFLIADVILTFVIRNWLVTIYMTAFSAVYLLIGRVFLPYVNKAVSKGLISYPVSEQKWERPDVLAAAKTIEEEMPHLQVSVYDEWIDVTLNWKNILGIYFTGMIREQESFQKMFLLSDHYTYQELDMESIGTVQMDPEHSFFISHKVFYGHTRQKKISVNTAMDINTGNNGIVQNSLDTDEITNYMHKWFADKGYALKE